MQKKPLVALIAASTILAGCGEVNNTQSGAQAPLVVTQDVTVIDYQPSKSYIGRIEAVEDTNITAQISGYLKTRHFEEGQMVEKDQLLYSIEPSSFEAQVASAKATLAQAKAALKKAELDHQRGKNLLPRGSISQSEFDALTAALLGAKAELEAANAQLKLADVNLSYTQIRAPFSGRIGSTKVSTGDLVSPSSGVLTTLVSLDPVHTSFSVSERERLAMGMDQMKGDGSEDSSRVEVQLELENGEFFEHLGQLDFLGNRIDTKTGTIAMRAIVDNPEHKLLPGQHIRVNLRDKNTSDVIVVPRRAVQTDLEGSFVMVTTEGNIAERRNVELGSQVEQGIIIREGLEQNDSVITQGLQRIRNGVEVNIQTPTEDKQ
ncbi:multidrug efflux RND transporter periplasmic adaptor subunit VmeY [Vibrio sp. B1FLJ16]|uniref:multidrug efflux RND transporter periplasmic adaptor subunit VmeY n=1 Tax=Vibrio sp. B1FLJ16 TaxID=2751178 RepID=UPI0015F4D973|nr:multidrug efflux RND transporter periplasmic adaptor subunit VmeY [Vibrio sp. B1FLJ16]CAD7817555.1 Belongs to the membrane fusion protein (MFP) (TC 8.A.1) family [Vibrio sp. B1FLJ16]CAE6931535.1 Belongs to the membrane fusion protein (MFP) (TC 8.A.1) family [Vibrio sp. B1FLJ16]